MIERIVVGWDGSAPAQRALDWVRGLHPTLPVTLVRVVGASKAPVEAFVANSPAAAARVELIDDGERFRSRHPGATVFTELIEGSPADELAGLSTPSTMVVVGTHRRAAFPGRFGWSVGARLAASASGPVAIIPDLPDSGLGEILVGVDGSAASAAAVRLAATTAYATGWPLHLLHSWEPGTGDPDVAWPHHQAVLDAAITGLGELASTLSIRRSLIEAPAALALLDASADAALLMVGKHRAHGARRMLLGSVTHSLLVDLRVPTVVVPAD